MTWADRGLVAGKCAIGRLEPNSTPKNKTRIGVPNQCQREESATRYYGSPGSSMETGAPCLLCVFLAALGCLNLPAL